MSSSEKKGQRDIGRFTQLNYGAIEQNSKKLRQCKTQESTTLPHSSEKKLVHSSSKSLLQPLKGGMATIHQQHRRNRDLEENANEPTEDVGLVSEKAVAFSNRRLESELESVPFSTLLLLNSYVFVYALITVTLSMLVLPTESEILFPSNEAIGLAGLLGIAGISQLVCPVAGFFSDRNTSRNGRRRPYATLGVIFALLALSSLYISRTYYTVGLIKALSVYRFLFIASYCVLMVSLNVSYASYAGLVPDMVPPSQYGEASGAMALQTTLGSLIGVSLVGFVEMDPYLLYMSTLTFVAFCLWRYVKEEQYQNASTQELGCSCDTFYNIANVYSISVKEEPDFFFVWISRLLYYTGMSAQAFMQYFLRDVIGRKDDAVIQTALVTMIAMATGSLVSIPCGIFSDRLGKRKPLVYLSCITMSITFIAWIGAHQMLDVFLWSGLFGIANGTYLSVDYALACATMPNKGENARFLAVWGVAAFIGSTLGPLICGPALYQFGRTESNFRYSREGYASVLLIGASFVLISALVLRFVKVA
mmetsp:Transcript_9166/g.11948  ORF Transcript_9166/g.11948 Transcript_9166/m.11948 type:complete len:534 (-) Transcript_9166:1023-2624(-)